MLRAIRLVVDTGFHYKHWSRQQVVDFFHEHSAIDEPEVQSETDRYMAWPAQALGYKIGQLEILKLRQYSKDQLGAKFDMRAFHDEVLAGALCRSTCSHAHPCLGDATESASRGPPVRSTRSRLVDGARTEYDLRSMTTPEHGTCAPGRNLFRQ